MGGENSGFQFDDVRVEPDSFRIWKAGHVVPVEPKAFEVLLFLIRNRGRLIQKSELLDAVWKDAFVTENALTREIALLRKALGEDARHSKYIETVPRRGYRFIAEVEKRVPATPPGRAGGAGAGAAEDGGTPPAAGARPAATAEDFVARAGAGGRRAARPFARGRLVAALVTLVLLSGGGLALWLARAGRAPVEAVSVRRVTQLTASVGLDFYPSISPDGGYVAYSSDKSGGFEIYVRQVAPGGREIQITSDGATSIQPAWSPDGRHLAYHSQRRGGIWIVPALGGVARRLSEFGSKPAWSRDGAMLAFQSASVADLTGLGAGALPPSTLWVIPARGGGPARQITQIGEPSGGHGAPVWSPDGKRIYFSVFDLTMSQIWSVAAGGGDLKRISASASASDFVFSPDGRAAYFAGLLKGPTFGLWKVSVSPSTGEPEGEPVRVESTGTTPIRHLSISADGKRIVYSLVSLSSNIWSVPVVPGGGGQPAGEPAPLFEDTSRRKTNPAFSPDGRRLAFGVWRMGVPYNVWIIDADGSNPRPMAADEEGSGLPNWMPDGDSIVFTSSRQGRSMFWSRNLATGEERPVAEVPADASVPRLSPDGKRVAFNSRHPHGRINLWTMELAGGAPRQLTFDDELAGFPAWSPDGRLIALEVKRGEDIHIAVMPAEGGRPLQLTSDPGQSWPHSFSPDGDKIAYARLSDGVWNIWWLSRGTGEKKRLTNFSKPNSYVRYPAWSPRGDQIAFEYAEQTGNVWLLELK